MFIPIKINSMFSVHSVKFSKISNRYISIYLYIKFNLTISIIAAKRKKYLVDVESKDHHSPLMPPPRGFPGTPALHLQEHGHYSLSFGKDKQTETDEERKQRSYRDPINRDYCCQEQTKCPPESEDPHPYCRGEAARGCDDGHPSPLDPALDEAATCDQYFDLPARGSTTRHCDEGHLELLKTTFGHFSSNKLEKLEAAKAA